MNKKRHKLKATLAAGAAIVGIVTLGTLKAGAAPIIVLNSSFEQISGDGGATDWSGFNFVVNSDANYLSTANGTGASGSHFLDLYGDYIGNPTNYGFPSTQTQQNAAQTTGYTVKTGDVITLTLAIGSNGVQNFPGDQTQADYVGDVELTIGGQVVSTNSLAETPAVLVTKGFVPLTMTYTVQAGDAGLLGINLTADNAQSLGETGNSSRRFYDNVNLDVVTSAPEPSTWAMLMGGVAALLGLRRFRRQA